jgi:hypothetical protein
LIHEPHPGVAYKSFIAQLVNQREARVYLEIGVQSGINLSGISVDTAFGVDPDFNLTTDPTVGKRVLRLHRMTSDAFFRDHGREVRAAGLVDFAFLDGMHLFEYLLRDFYNTEAVSSKLGLITIHDCMPFDGEMIERINNYTGRTPGPNAGAWTGDVWKVILILEKYRPDLSVVLVDCAPTGLVCISGLDPSSTVLKDKYREIVAEFAAMPNDLGAIQAFYADRSVTSASAILSNYQQSLYFAM